jgi:hypothetical protein
LSGAALLPGYGYGGISASLPMPCTVLIGTNSLTGSWVVAAVLQVPLHLQPMHPPPAPTQLPWVLVGLCLRRGRGMRCCWRSRRAGYCRTVTVAARSHRWGGGRGGAAWCSQVQVLLTAYTPAVHAKATHQMLAVAVSIAPGRKPVFLWRPDTHGEPVSLCPADANRAGDHDHQATQPEAL